MIKKCKSNSKIILHNSYTAEAEHFKNHNFENIEVRILDIIPDIKNRLNYETLRILENKTLYPYGLNTWLSDKFKKVPLTEDIYHFFKTYNYKLINRNKRGKKKHCPTNIPYNFNLLLEEISKMFNETNFIKNIKNKFNGIKKSVLRSFSVFLKDKEIINTHLKDLIGNYFIHLKIPIKKPKMTHNYCVVRFKDKILDKVNIRNIFNEYENLFPINNHDTIVSYKYDKNIGSYLKNNKLKEGDFYDVEACNCQQYVNTEFFNQDHGHVLTGNLNLIQNNDLKLLMEHGSKFRQSFIRNKDTVLKNLTEDLEIYLIKTSNRFGIPIHLFEEWKFNVLRSFKNKLKYFFLDNNNHLKKKDIFELREEIHKKYVITTIDKAEGNYAVICKKYYIEIINIELQNKATFEQVNIHKDDILNNIESYYNLLHIKSKKISHLPIIYANPKFHKDPIKFRFITSSVNTAKKEIDVNFEKKLKLILNKVKKVTNNLLHNNWIINSNNDLIKLINTKNYKKAITYDFENLYTSLPTEEIYNTLMDLYEEFNLSEFMDSERWKNYLNCGLFENYIEFKGKIFKQINGIPTGTNYSTSICNLFLFYKEYHFIMNTTPEISENFKSTFRYIDDVICLDNNYTDLLEKDIYPTSLKLNKTSFDKNNLQYLDLNLLYEDNKLITSLYDKRKAFAFKVNRYIQWNSNVSKKVIANTLVSQVIRLNRLNYDKKCFLEDLNNLIQHFLNNKVPKKFIDYHLNKITFLNNLLG